MREFKISVLFIFLNLCFVVPLISKSAKGSEYKRIENFVPTISYQLIPALENTWGYDIYLDGKLAIHQPSIPAVSGNKGFVTKEQATKVAKAVIQKIKKGQMPPTISVEELKKLKAI